MPLCHVASTMQLTIKRVYYYRSRVLSKLAVKITWNWSLKFREWYCATIDRRLAMKSYLYAKDRLMLMILSWLNADETLPSRHDYHQAEALLCTLHIPMC